MTTLAYLFTFLKNAIYGTTNFFTKELYENNLDAIDILALRFLLSFVILWVLKTLKILKIDVGVKDVFGEVGKLDALAERFEMTEKDVIEAARKAFAAK